MSSSPLTVIVLTLNEEQSLPACLASVMPLTSQLLVLDSGSSDRTLAIANAYGCRIEQRAFLGYASQRNAALDLVETEWALFVDADETLRPPLVNEISSVIRSAPADTAGYWIPRRNRMFGQWIQGGGWWPDCQARLLRTGRAWYDPEHEVHERVIFNGATGRLSQAMIHDNYASRVEFIVKQRRYTELRSITQTAVPSRKAYLSMPVREFWRRFAQLTGYRDGLTGCFLASVLAAEEFRFVRRGRASNGRNQPR